MYIEYVPLVLRLDVITGVFVVGGGGDDGIIMIIIIMIVHVNIMHIKSGNFTHNAKNPIPVNLPS